MFPIQDKGNRSPITYVPGKVPMLEHLVDGLLCVRSILLVWHPEHDNVALWTPFPSEWHCGSRDVHIAVAYT